RALQCGPVVTRDSDQMSRLSSLLGRSSLLAGLGRLPTRHLRYQIIIPYLLLALVFAIAGTIFLSRSASETIQAQFDTQLLNAVRGGGNSLAQLGAQHVEALRPMLYTRGLPEAMARRDSAQLNTLIAPLAVNSGFDRVAVVAGDGTLLLDWRPDTGG